MRRNDCLTDYRGSQTCVRYDLRHCRRLYSSQRSASNVILVDTVFIQQRPLSGPTQLQRFKTNRFGRSWLQSLSRIRFAPGLKFSACILPATFALRPKPWVSQPPGSYHDSLYFQLTGQPLPFDHHQVNRATLLADTMSSQLIKVVLHELVALRLQADRYRLAMLPVDSRVSFRVDAEWK